MTVTIDVSILLAEPECSLPVVGKHVYRPLVEGDAGPGDENGHFPVSLHLAGTVLSLRQVLVNRKDIEVEIIFSITMALDNCEN